MKSLFVLCAWLALCSCASKSPEETAREEFHKIISSNITDRAFADNRKVKVYQLSVLKVDTLSAALYDTLKIVQLLNKKKFYSIMFDNRLELMKIEGKKAALYAGIMGKAMVDMAMDDVKESREEVQKYLDTLTAYEAADSIIRSKIDKNSEVKYYEVKAFLKMTSYDKADSTNFMDTTYYHFDQMRRLVDPWEEAKALIRYNQ